MGWVPGSSIMWLRAKAEFVTEEEEDDGNEERETLLLRVDSEEAMCDENTYGRMK
jgi:hypothetical protein